ncbi:hypothetical protein BsWGS_00215 [Bradybaena similaris]
MIYSSNSDCSQVVIFTDALAVLQALKSGKLSHLRSVLDKVSERYKVTLQWVPSHCGVPGNERADSLAKKGGECEQPDNEVTYFEKKRAIQAIRKDRCSANDDYHTLDRRGQSIVFRLRTGHNRLNKHMHRIHVSPTPLCPCGMGEQTAKHVLQECPEHSELRRKYWPSDVSFKQKLYGNREELKTTVKFITDTNLAV